MVDKEQLYITST